MDSDSDQSGSRPSTPNYPMVLDDREYPEAFPQDMSTLKRKIGGIKGSKVVYELSGRGKVHLR